MVKMSQKIKGTSLYSKYGEKKNICWLEERMGLGLNMRLVPIAFSSYMEVRPVLVNL